MESFFSGVGIIAVILVLVVLLDNYSSSNKPKERIVYPNPIIRLANLRLIAKSMGCEPENAMFHFWNNSGIRQLNDAQLYEMLEDCQKKKHLQAKEFKIHPDDTRAAHLETWLLAYIMEKELYGP